MTLSHTMTMTTITELLADDAARGALLRDAEEVLSRRVAASRGITGMAVRAGYAAFQRVQPGIVPSALGRLAPHFAPIVDRHWQQAQQTDDPVDHFAMHAPAIAADLLEVTDGMARSARSAVLVRIYRSLRERAQEEVAGSMPDVAGLLQRHIG